VVLNHIEVVVLKPDRSGTLNGVVLKPDRSCGVKPDKRCGFKTR
jgi:hypothetical protein